MITHIVCGDRSKTNYLATKRRTKTTYCTLSGRYPHPDAASLCVWCSSAGWTMRWTRAASDNNFFSRSASSSIYPRRSLSKAATNMVYGASRSCRLHKTGGNEEGFRWSPLRSSIMCPLSSVLSSIPHVYLAYIMYRVSA